MKKIFSIVIVAIVCTVGCKNIVDKIVKEQGIKIHQGFNKSGHLASCVTSDAFLNQACTEEFGPNERFAEECKKQGSSVSTCGCHSYLCSRKLAHQDAKPDESDEPTQPPEKPAKKTFSGYDRKGNKQSCTVDPNPNQACTMVYTDGDKFGADCAQSGHEAYRCGCHEFLCSQPLNNVDVNIPKEDSVTYKGYDMNGEMSSCTITPGLTVMCLVAPPSAERYRQECLSRDGEVSACYCQNYLCSKRIPFKK